MGRALGGSIDRLGLGKFGANLANNMAGGIANAATRSLVNGSDFGDNLMAALPDILGNTIGNLVADGISTLRKPAPTTIVTASAAEVDASSSATQETPAANGAGASTSAAPGKDVTNKDGVVTKIQGLHLTAEQFEPEIGGLLKRLGGDPKDGIKTQKGYDNAVKQATSSEKSVRGLGTPIADVGGNDEGLNDFARRIANAFSGKKIGGTSGQGFERFITVGVNGDGKFIVTSVQTVNVGGGSGTVYKGTVAIIHSHRTDFGYDPRPGGGDSAVVSQFKIPNFIVGEPSHNPSLFEVGRIGSQLVQRTIGAVGKMPSRWVPFSPPKGD